MTTVHVPEGRLRAYAQFLAAIFYFFLARALAHRGAIGLAPEQFTPLVEQAMLLFLLLVGFTGMGFAINRQQHPMSEQGLARRPGFRREIGMGLTIGWAAALICTIAMALGGGIVIRLSLDLRSWGWLVADALYFAFLAMAEEVAFRGYVFQRFTRAVGSTGAVLGFGLLYAFLMAVQIGTTRRVSLAFWFLFSVLLSTAYLRTRALWVSWGLNFGWKASRALLFGLAVNGDTSHTPIVQGDPTGPFWLTGAGFGLEGSWFAFLVLMAAIPVLYSATRDLDFRYNVPELIPGGIAVDLDAAARRQHEQAMGAAPAQPTLVQIAPLSNPQNGQQNLPEIPQAPPNTGNESL